MSAYLVVESGPLRGRRFTLNEGTKVTIGRDERCTLRLNDGMVSRLHCAISSQAGAWRIADQKSSNSTLVNGAPVADAPLQPGDLIQIGETLLSFAAADADPLLGAFVGGHRIEARLGRGAMGTVYLARQLSIDRPVALKLLPSSLARDAEFIRSFLAEARAAGRLNHPNVVQVYDAGRDGEHYYISMEYLEGGSLEERLLKEGRLGAAAAVPLGLDAAEALAYAERQRMVHRDIKPANLLLAADGRAKVGDLGLAADLSGRGLRAGGRIAGSPRYMAPEQALGEAYDHRADIYALGATLYRTLAGVPPHDGPTAKAVITAKLERDPKPLREHAPDVPPALAAVVHRMMARDPEARYGSAAEVAAALNGASARGGRRPRPARRRAGARSSPAGSGALVAGGVLVVALLIGAGLHFGRGGNPEAGSSPPATVIGSASETTAATPVTREAEEERDRTGRGTAAATAARAHDDARADAAERAAAAQKLAADGKETAAEALALVGQGKVARAASLLDAWEARNPTGANVLTPARAEIAAAASRLVEKARTAAASRLAANDFSGARGEVEAVLLEVPRDHASDLQTLRGEIDAAEEKSRAAAGDAAGVARRARVQIGGLDFGGAGETLEAALAGDAFIEPHLKPLREEIRLARQAWEALEGAVAKLAAEKKSARFAFPHGPLARKGGEEAPGARTAAAKEEPQLRTYRVLQVDPPAVRLEPAGEKTHVMRSVLSLPDQALLELAGAGSGASPAPEIREGMGLLLLYHCGPERARALLLEGEQDETRRRAAEAKLTAAAGTWLEARRHASEARQERNARAEPPARAEAWEFAAADVAEQIAAWRARGGATQPPAILRELFLKAREEALVRLPPESLFHAKTVKIAEGGTIELAYDFSSAEQLEDFTPVGNPAMNPRTWVKGKKLMTLKGEVRFLSGEPFRGRLAVGGTAAGFDPAAPNINVVLWTGERDAVTANLGGRGIDLRRWRDADGTLPADYFLVGMGYRLPGELEALLENDRGRNFPGGLQNLLPAYLRDTTHVVLAGDRGRSLHADRRELIWQSGLPGKLPGPARFQVSMDGGTLLWSVNRKVMSLADSLVLDRLKAKVPHSGSFSLLTNGREVHYAAFEVKGDLDPAWVRQRARAQAEKELAALTGAAGAAAAPPAETAEKKS